MLSVKQLLSLSVNPPVRRDRKNAPNLMANSSEVSISFGKTHEAQDARGYYKAIVGRALSSGKQKKQKKFEIRLYYPASRIKSKQFIPPGLRDPKKKYEGPDKAPLFTAASLAALSCSCEYFLFHCEVADAQTDNADIKYSNGKFPKVTNHRGIPHLCKHLISAIRKGALLKK